MQKMNKNYRKLQIGVIGSCADLKYSNKMAQLAEEVGFWVAEKNAALIFGAEKDIDSLSAAACKGAKKNNGLTIGITYGKTKDDVVSPDADIIIPTGLERGGGREFVLVLSADVLIAINGGSGTLNEMVIAYQAGIPIICLANSGGWSGKMAGQFFDQRKRLKILPASTPKEAVELATKSVGGIWQLKKA